MEKNRLKIIVSGGGTGGHIFPAISIANALREQCSEADILFVGAEGRMEMERVPKAGYRIVGLPVVGFQRKLTLKNITFFFKLFSSMRRANRIIADFKPDVAVGVGGYASGPILKAAQRKGIATLLQEQNSFAGVTNKMLAKKALKICVAYSGMEKYFPAQKIMLTGNPVRQDLEHLKTTRAEAFEFFNIPPQNRVVLVVGGSLGARTINESILAHLSQIESTQNLTVIWQTGKYYHNEIKQRLQSQPCSNIRLFDFVNRMDLAYTAANLVISRAGAGTISEICLVAKPAILVPSPNVAEDHQTHNAMALVANNAAVMVKDSEAQQQLVDTALKMVANNTQLEQLSANVLKMALPNSANIIAQEVIKIAKD